MCGWYVAVDNGREGEKEKPQIDHSRLFLYKNISLTIKIVSLNWHVTNDFNFNGWDSKLLSSHIPKARIFVCHWLNVPCCHCWHDIYINTINENVWADQLFIRSYIPFDYYFIFFFLSEEWSREYYRNLQKMASVHLFQSIHLLAIFNMIEYRAFILIQSEKAKFMKKKLKSHSHLKFLYCHLHVVKQKKYHMCHFSIIWDICRETHCE